MEREKLHQNFRPNGCLILFSIWVLNKPAPNPGEEIAKCIGENSVLYVKEGCVACIKQEQKFGENIKYLTIIDCAKTIGPCLDVGLTVTPTWVIGGQKYEGVHTIDELKQLTGC